MRIDGSETAVGWGGGGSYFDNGKKSKRNEMEGKAMSEERGWGKECGGKGGTGGRWMGGGV
jgi:hypothetical protein